jgi:hypothetical protein
MSFKSQLQQISSGGHSDKYAGHIETIKVACTESALHHRSSVEIDLEDLDGKSVPQYEVDEFLAVLRKKLDPSLTYSTKRGHSKRIGAGKRCYCGHGQRKFGCTTKLVIQW